MVNHIGFDRAADFYDETRDLDPAARRKLTDILVKEVQGRDLLEVGIGTGLVGLALARQGVRVSGVDLSTEMLHKLADKFVHPDEVVLFHADATELPFDDCSFDAVLTSQMLHLLDDWRRALDELTRVVRPCGIILIDLGNEPDSGWGGPWSDVAAKFWEYARPEGRRRPEVWLDGAVEQYLLGKGLSGRPLEKVTAFENLSLGDVISRLERGFWSACWTLKSEELTGCAEKTRTWAGKKFGDLRCAYRVSRVIGYRAYELGVQSTKTVDQKSMVLK